jgi:hypothetical protein
MLIPRHSQLQNLVYFSKNHHFTTPLHDKYNRNYERHDISRNPKTSGTACDGEEESYASL